MILDFVVVLIAIPVGYLLAWLAREELVPGRVWFQRLAVISLVLGMGLWAYGMPTGLILGLFLAILAFIAYCQSFNRRLTTKQKI
ncbi:hypothetical protein EXS73_00070 [Candidatus Pacearchaeota archaeon]|nr:hypothetical protein [Candidatus Pacearchaeota archaeon]